MELRGLERRDRRKTGEEGDIKVGRRHTGQKTNGEPGPGSEGKPGLG